jgi:hypothetical protein
VTPSSLISSAISRIVDVPEPLSLMPGPSTTESRWAPTTVTSSALPAGVSASTFQVLASRFVSVDADTRTIVSPACAAS